MNALRLRRGRALAALLLGAVACSEPAARAGPTFSSQPPAQGAPVYVLAVYPLHNPAKLLAAYEPIVDHVNRRLQGAQLALEASRDYASFEAKVQARGPELILPNPLQALRAMRCGYHVIARVGEPSEFRGLLVVRRDSRITRPTDLERSTVAYPSPTAHAACILPQWFLHTRGVDVGRLENLYVGSQESAILNVYLGRAAAAGTWPTPWRAFLREHPAEAAELKVMWETEPVMANAVMVRDDVAPEVAGRIREALVELGATAEGQALLGGAELTGFHPASDRDYDAARTFVARFEREVRPLEAP